MSAEIFQLVQGNAGIVWAAAQRGWNLTESRDVCDWEGIACNQRNEVVSIDLEGTGLLGTIPSSLGTVKSLLYLNLKSNHLYGTIPRAVLSLPHLVYINLSKNKLHGTIPALKLRHISEINLSHNSFHGALPANLGRWNTKLTRINVASNRLKGTIPSNFQHLQDLVTLNLSDNRFYGTIPDCIAKLRNVRSLSLHNNDLVGNIPISFGSNLLVLEHLLLQNNQLSGTLPTNLAKLPLLKVLLVDRNHLTGTVPQQLCQRDLNQILFSSAPPFSDEEDVAITSEPADHADDTFSAEFRSNSNDLRAVQQQNDASATLKRSCAAIACPSGYRSAEGNSYGGVYPCVKCNGTAFNEYLGAATCNSLSEGEIFHRLVHQHQELPRDEPIRPDALQVDTSPCHETGVTCNDEGHITAIVLEARDLEGTIPEELGYLPHLEELDLSDNLFRGKIPSSLRFAHLRRLDLSGNLLTGIIPPELCRTAGINGNGKNGFFSCDHVACPVATFSPVGYASGREKCFECPHGGDELTTLGSRDCKLRPLSKARTEDLSNKSVRRSMSETGKIVLICVAFFVATVYCWLRRRSQATRDACLEGKGAKNGKSKGTGDTERTRLDDWYDYESEYSEHDIGLTKILEEGDDDDDNDVELWLDHSIHNHDVVTKDNIVAKGKRGEC